MAVGTSVKGVQIMEVYTPPGPSSISLILPSVGEQVLRIGFLSVEVEAGGVFYQVQGVPVWTQAVSFITLPPYQGFPGRVRGIWRFTGVPWELFLNP